MGERPLVGERVMRMTGNVSGMWVAWMIAFAASGAWAQASASPDLQGAQRASAVSGTAGTGVAQWSALAPAPAGDSHVGARLGRYGAELLGGLGGGLAAGLVGIGVTQLAACGFELSACSVMIAGYWGGGIGGAIGIIAGTWLVGHLLDGDGAWWAILPGMALSVAGGLFALQRHQRHGEAYPGAYSATLVGTVAGAILLGALGYELTSHPSARAFREARISLVPTWVPGAQGTLQGGLALSGTWN